MRKCRRVASGDATEPALPTAFVNPASSGTVRLVNGKYQALTRDGSLLGAFDALWAAVAALPEAPNETAGTRQHPGQ
jgi:hypothetical protein